MKSNKITIGLFIYQSVFVLKLEPVNHLKQKKKMGIRAERIWQIKKYDKME